METVIAMGMFVLTAFSVVLSVFIYKSGKREKKLDQYMDGEIKRRELARATGSLAYHTAYAVSKAEINGRKLCNGEVSDAMKFYKVKEHELDNFYQKSNVVNNVKGVV